MVFGVPIGILILFGTPIVVIWVFYMEARQRKALERKRAQEQIRPSSQPASSPPVSTDFDQMPSTVIVHNHNTEVPKSPVFLNFVLTTIGAIIAGLVVFYLTTK